MKKKILIIAVTIIAVILVAFGLFQHFKGKNSPDTVTDTDTTAQKISITLEISADGKSEDYQISTTAQTLGKALVESSYVQDNQEQYGLYIKTVYGLWKDGRTADDSKQEWWCITKNGQSVLTGADKTPIADGEKYELTLKTGY